MTRGSGAAAAARARELRRALRLAPHPEGGWYSETYRAPLRLSGLPHGAPRCAATAIYFHFLLTARSPRSHLHRLRSDELFHLYEGGPLDLVLLQADDAVRRMRLGRDLAAGERPQLVVPAGTWFGARLVPGAGWALVGCTVAPGFDFADFELAGPQVLRRHPRSAAALRDLVRRRAPRARRSPRPPAR